MLSRDGCYRYALTRDLRAYDEDIALDDIKSVMFVMLNPSTADAAADDPTIRRCKGFARREHASSLLVTNVYGYRATNPKALAGVRDAEGRENRFWLRHYAAAADVVVVAWGNHDIPAYLINEVGLNIRDCGRHKTVYCLGTTKSGAPRHPLYVRADQPLVPWNGFEYNGRAM